MKKYFWVILLFPIIYYSLSGKRERVTVPEKMIPSRATAPGNNSPKLFLNKRTTAKTPPANDCESIAGKLDVIDFNHEVREWFGLLKAGDFTKCTDPEVQDRISRIQTSCFQTVIKKEECFTDLLMFRSLMRVRKIKEPSTREELADLILAEFSKKIPDFKMLKRLSGELLRQDPNDRPVQKVWAMSAVIAGDPRNLKPELVEEIYQTLDPEQFKTDPDLRSLDILLKTKLDARSVEAYTRKILEQNASDAGLREMLGWSLWQQGKRTESLAELDALIA